MLALHHHQDHSLLYNRVLNKALTIGNKDARVRRPQLSTLMDDVDDRRLCQALLRLSSFVA